MVHVNQRMCTPVNRLAMSLRSDHSANGFFAYDHISGGEVLVMVVVLFHLGDSPMHAEISNTTNPANTLTPCRICDLQVTQMSDKKTQQYVSDFIGVDLDGEQVCYFPLSLTLLYTHIRVTD